MKIMNSDGLTRDSMVSGRLVHMHFCSSESGASFQELVHDVALLHPSMDEKGMTTIRLQRLHFSSIPCPRTLAISCPHSQRVSLP